MPSHQGGVHSADGRWGCFLRAAESERKREGSGVRTAEKGGKKYFKKYFGEKKKAVTFALPIGGREAPEGERNGRDAREGEKKQRCTGGAARRMQRRPKRERRRLKF
ncbi:hypothetical protein, partial [Olivibacter sp. XZL3]|uniref:hypothetical protein n=1 Tax=Olivibacter sp. XZL3 TaxID=1735116 RepID=UPI0010659B88